MLVLIILNNLSSSFSTEYLKVLSSVLFFSSYTLLLSALSFLIHQQATIYMLMTLSFFCLSQPLISLITSLTWKTLYQTFPTGCQPTSSLLILPKTEFLIIGLPQQLSKLNSPTIPLPNNSTLSPVDFARNLGVIFDKNLSFAQHVSSVSKACFLNIRDLRRIRNTVDHSTACTIATSRIHSKLDYCT